MGPGAARPRRPYRAAQNCTRQSVTSPAFMYGSSRTNPSIASGPMPRNTSAAPVGGSPSAPASTMWPASRWDCKWARCASRWGTRRSRMSSGIVVEQDVEALVVGHGSKRISPALAGRDTLCVVADLQRRGSYTPRRAREQRAYRLVVAGGTAGVIGVVTLVLAIAGVMGATIPVIALIVAVLCAVMFRRTVAGR